MLKFSFVWNFYNKTYVEVSLVISGTAKQDCIILLYRLVLLYWSRIINNFLSLFWRYISFIRYFFIMLICKCFSITLLKIFWNQSNFTIRFVTNEISSCFYCFLNCSFLSSFKCICCSLFSVIQKFLAIFTTKFWLIFLQISLPIFLAKNKKP